MLGTLHNVAKYNDTKVHHILKHVGIPVALLKQKVASLYLLDGTVFVFETSQVPLHHSYLIFSCETNDVQIVRQIGTSLYQG